MNAIMLGSANTMDPAGIKTYVEPIKGPGKLPIGPKFDYTKRFPKV